MNWKHCVFYQCLRGKSDLETKELQAGGNRFTNRTGIQSFEPGVPTRSPIVGSNKEIQK
jgi:hypothetical protein